MVWDTNQVRALGREHPIRMFGWYEISEQEFEEALGPSDFTMIPIKETKFIREYLFLVQNRHYKKVMLLDGINSVIAFGYFVNTIKGTSHHPLTDMKGNVIKGV